MSDTTIMVILGVVTLAYFVILATAHVWMVPREHLPKGFRERRRSKAAQDVKPASDDVAAGHDLP